MSQTLVSLFILCEITLQGIAKFCNGWTFFLYIKNVFAWVRRFYAAECDLHNL